MAASTLLGLAIVLVTHHAARRDHRFVWAVGGVAVLQVVLLLLIGDSAGNIIWVNVIAGVAVLVVERPSTAAIATASFAASCGWRGGTKPRSTAVIAARPSPGAE